MALYMYIHVVLYIHFLHTCNIIISYCVSIFFLMPIVVHHTYSRSSPSLKKTSRIPRGTETTTKGMPSFHTSKTPLLTKTTTKIPKLTIDTIIRGKRLRSVSLEKLTDLEENGSCHKRSRSRTSSAETSEEDGSSMLYSICS